MAVRAPFVASVARSVPRLNHDQHPDCNQATAHARQRQCETATAALPLSGTYQDPTCEYQSCSCGNHESVSKTCIFDQFARIFTVNTRLLIGRQVWMLTNDNRTRLSVVRAVASTIAANMNTTSVHSSRRFVGFFGRPPRS